jgi:hypothetical protein
MDSNTHFESSSAKCHAIFNRCNAMLLHYWKKIELAFRSLEICLTGRLHAERCRATDAAPATLGPLGFGNAKLPTATAVLDY